MSGAMNQSQRRIFLIKKLLAERGEDLNFEIPPGEYEQRRLLRSLLNTRMPIEADSEFLKIQDEYLQNELARKGTTELLSLAPLKSGFYLWQGDITRLKVGAIVNAANSQMLRCFCPCHGCIDNAIPFSITQSCMQSRTAHG